MTLFFLWCIYSTKQHVFGFDHVRLFVMFFVSKQVVMTSSSSASSDHAIAIYVHAIKSCSSLQTANFAVVNPHLLLKTCMTGYSSSKPEGQRRSVAYRAVVNIDTPGSHPFRFKGLTSEVAFMSCFPGSWRSVSKRHVRRLSQYLSVSCPWIIWRPAAEVNHKRPAIQS